MMEEFAAYIAGMCSDYYEPKPELSASEKAWKKHKKHESHRACCMCHFDFGFTAGEKHGEKHGGRAMLEKVKDGLSHHEQISGGCVFSILDELERELGG